MKYYNNYALTLSVELFLRITYHSNKLMSMQHYLLAFSSKLLLNAQALNEVLNNSFYKHTNRAAQRKHTHINTVK